MATSRSFDEFGKRIEILAENIEGNVLKTIKRAAMAADQAAVTLTPVDTGLAKVNWLTTVGAPATGTVETPGAGEAEAQALEQGRRTIGDYRLGQGGIFITNNLPYIGLLDQGSSTQRPEGMTDAAILAALHRFKNGRLL